MHSIAAAKVHYIDDITMTRGLELQGLIIMHAWGLFFFYYPAPVKGVVFQAAGTDNYFTTSGFCCNSGAGCLHYGKNHLHKYIV